jgi:hypothetical protein
LFGLKAQQGTQYPHANARHAAHIDPPLPTPAEQQRLRQQDKAPFEHLRNSFLN